MKRILLLLLIFSTISLSLFSIEVENSNAIAAEYRDMVVNEIISNLETRVEKNAKIESFSLENINDEYQVELSFSIEDQNYKVIVKEKNQKNISKELKNEIEKSLFYLETDVEGLKIDNIYNTAIIALTDDKTIKVGDLYNAKDINGKNIALLTVKEKEEDFVRFASIYNKSLYPGFALTKTNFFSLFAGVNFHLYNRFIPSSASITLINSSWLYPVGVVAEARVKYLPTQTYYLGLGLNYEILLSNFALDTFFLLKNASLGASALAYASYSENFGYAASYDIYYKVNLSNNISLKLGYDYIVNVTNRVATTDKSIKLNMGVRF